jgi:hypothetical protein
MRKPIDVRLHSLTRQGANGCLLWIGHTGHAGHGQIRNEDAVKLIRRDPRGPSELATVLHVSAATICDVRKRRSWRHVP